MHAPAGSPAQYTRSRWSSGLAIAAYMAIATVLIHMITGNRYGFQRDELATLEDARHLAWGYVAYPPVTPFFGRISLELFGTSVRGFRFFAAIAQALALFLTADMARRFGGGRWSQVIGAIAAIPFCFGGGALMQYVSFDYLAWVLVSYCTVRLLSSGNARWWIAIGAAIGFGMLSKYAMPFFVAGLIVGVLATIARRYFASKWLWMGAAIAFLIFLPNLLWQVRHNFIYLDFVRHIHARDIAEGRTDYFLPKQFEMTLLASPLWIAGLAWCFFSETGKQFRVIGWMYVVPLVLFIIARGREYYLAGAYPMLYAAGAVAAERWLSRSERNSSFKSSPAAVVADGDPGRRLPEISISRASRPPALRARHIFRALIVTALLVDAVFAAAFFLPIAPINSAWFKVASNLQGDYREEIGWPELVETVARVRDSLPAADRAQVGVVAANYGEAGAINLYGPQFGLPRAISGVNSFWYYGYPDPAPQAVIVLGYSRAYTERNFNSCRVAAHTSNRYGIANEESSDHPDIFVCGPPRQGWAELWKRFQHFG